LNEKEIKNNDHLSEFIPSQDINLNDNKNKGEVKSEFIPSQDINLSDNKNKGEVKIKENVKKDLKSEKSSQKDSIFHRIILPQLKKQIEYYFSDKNYYQDSFLLEKAGENAENCKKSS